jgi:NAD-dependent dihydropyrimidine dehydrogenase PreA subunit
VVDGDRVGQRVQCVQCVLCLDMCLDMCVDVYRLMPRDSEVSV